MAKAKTTYSCIECGYKSQKWLGMCPSCQKWNTFTEEVEVSNKGDRYKRVGTDRKQKAVKLKDIPLKAKSRLFTGISEFDRVLGGGAVPGSLILISGDPGIGKSTLLLQAAGSNTAKWGSVLYVSGEESLRQIKLRARRLRINAEELYLLAETNLDAILKIIEELKPGLLVMDSIQTVYDPELKSAPGSPTQIRECAANLSVITKRMGMVAFLVGHVTKEGSIAGPKLLEHMVDAVIYFEGEKNHSYRILRNVKNRFGSTNEIGIFEMRQDGLREVTNPSETLISNRYADVPGSVILPSMEGTRIVLVEIQALVSPTAFGMPRRMTTGFDLNRFNLLLAVLEKRIGLILNNQDAYLNVVGGIKVNEPAADLAVAMAVAGSYGDLSISGKTAVMGEVGLTGEVRGINQVEKRINEAVRLGFTKCIVPKDNMKDIILPSDVEFKSVRTVAEAFECVFSK